MPRAHCQPFDLVELHFRARGDLFIAEAHSRQRDADGGRVGRVLRRKFMHRADLPRRCVRPQQDRVVSPRSRIDIE